MTQIITGLTDDDITTQESPPSPRLAADPDTTDESSDDTADSTDAADSTDSTDAAD